MFFLEPEIDSECDKTHKNNDEWISVWTAKFGHEFKIHTVDTHNERQRHKEDREERQHTDDLIRSLR